MADIEEREAGRAVGWVRLGIGFAQGVAAWLLIREVERGSAQHWPTLFAALSVVVGFAPLIVLAGIGRMRPLVLAGWTVAAAGLLAALAAYDIWREPLMSYSRATRFWPSTQMLFFGAAAVFIAHHILEPAEVERRWPPSYREQFETAWRHGFQLALALTFTGLFWAVLRLSALLFQMIDIRFVGEVLRKPWFSSPATAAAFAAAVHLTDVRPALIRGVRTVGLTLLAWLLPVMATLTAGFLVALLFTGVQPLWATKRAAALLLSAAGVLVVLVNAAYQDGSERQAVPVVLRWTGRGAALLITPLTLLAAWATALRVGQYGLTPERVTSLAVLLAATLYAGGYAWAAVSNGPWLKGIERVNPVVAAVAVGLIVLLLSPLGDPARLSVADQVARLNRHATPTQTFDFDFLRFSAGRFGREALATLANSPDRAVAERAHQAQAQTSPYVQNPFIPTPAHEPAAPAAPDLAGGEPFAGAVVHPAGAKLPDKFRNRTFSAEEVQATRCLADASPCDIYVLRVAGAPQPEILVATLGSLKLFGTDAGQWRQLGYYVVESCGRDRREVRARAVAAIHRGELRTAAPRVPDLDAGGEHLTFSGRNPCASTVTIDPAPTPRTAPPPPPPPALGPAFSRR